MSESRPTRRSRRGLEDNLAQASTRQEEATARFELGLFHDNNGREMEAIPHYVASLDLGLPEARRAEGLAWLSSSLCKTGRPDEALERARQAMELTTDASLTKFLHGVERRLLAG